MKKTASSGHAFVKNGRRKRKGVHAKRRSNNKASKNYKKAYRGQGR